MAAKDTADVLLIGSGAAGGPFAWALSQVPGIKIVCLEQGDWDRDPRERHEVVAQQYSASTWLGGGVEGRPRPEGNRDADEEFERLTKKPRQPGANYYVNGYPYDHTESYWEPVMGNHVGGAMVHYGGGWDRFHTSDFLWRSLTGLTDDWPIRYFDLAPFYDANDNMIGVTGVPGNPAFPPRSVNMLPTAKLNAGSDILRGACDKLGWHWWPGESANISVPFKGRDPKSPRERKNRADLVHWPEAIRNGVVLKTRATVREVTVTKQGLADGAVYYDADGKLHEQKARLVVLACNGIGTPRVLLNSKSARFPQGLANRSGFVGKCLMAHPLGRVVAAFEDSNAAPALGGTGLACHEFYDVNLARGFVGGFTLTGGGYSTAAAVALGKPPEAFATVIPASLEQGPGRSRQALAWGRAHHAAFQARYKHTMTVTIIASELPDEQNRVEIHPTLTDDFGIPAPKLFYRQTENTNKMMAFAFARGKELLETAGASKVVSAELDTAYMGRGAAPGHYLGTARMGTDPARSVVDQWGRAHDVKNLFVIDGSVFTTCGATVPTSTIQAIALRIADYIKNNAKQLLTT